MAELLMGDEAVALAALDAGIGGVFSYPGTPATEILESVRRWADPDRGIATAWSANEKVAYEEAMGMSFVGQRCLAAMKHVVLNVAADPFMSSALTGVVGGLVLVVADDPGMHSSQNEQDTRYYADFARLPLLEPSNQQEAYDMVREAFAYSEKVELPVVVRLVTRLSHSRSIVHRRPGDSLNGRPRRGDPRNWTLLPVNARRRNKRLIDLQSDLRGYSEASRHNQLTLGPRRGIVASGAAWNYVREALGEDKSYSLLKVSTYPLPVRLIRELVDHCEEVLVVEDGYPFIESKLVGLLGIAGKAIGGRLNGTIPGDGELSTEIVRAALHLPSHGTYRAYEDLPGRPPMLCQGCPHCDTFRMITEAAGQESDPILFSDIGCYTLGAYPPYNAVHSCVDMGASISMAHGAAKAGAHPVICTIGDSTFTHSGMTALLGAAHENANMTVMILDNATVAMTGGQDIFVTGEAFIRLIRGLGVDARHVVHVEPTPKGHEQNVTLLREEIEYRGLSVFIATRACIHMKRRAPRSIATTPAATTGPSS